MSHEARDKCNLDDELNKMIINLQEKIEEHKAKVPPTLLADLNEVRNQVNTTTRQLMSTVSQVQLQQATASILEKKVDELGSEVQQQKQNLD